VRARLLESERAARAEAQAAEVRLRDVVEQAPLAVAVMEGPDHVYTLVSPRYAQTPGMGRPLLGRSMRDAFPEIASQGYIDVMDDVYRTGVPYFAAERQVFITSPSGALEERYYNVGYQPLRDATGAVYAVASASYDVTDHVQARREVEIARAQAETRRDLLDAVLAQTPVGVVIVEAPSGRVVVINDVAARLWGQRPTTQSVERYSAEWVGYHADGSPIASHEWPLARVLADGVPIASEIVQIEHRDGHRVLVEIADPDE
jgi:PAS domain-containing protein